MTKPKDNRERHKWIKTELEPVMKDTFSEKHTCELCGCERHKSKRGFFNYSRSGQVFSYTPKCWGKNLNSNKID